MIFPPNHLHFLNPSFLAHHRNNHYHQDWVSLHFRIHRALRCYNRYPQSTNWLNFSFRKLYHLHNHVQCHIELHRNSFLHRKSLSFRPPGSWICYCPREQLVLDSDNYWHWQEWNLSDHVLWLLWRRNYFWRKELRIHYCVSWPCWWTCRVLWSVSCESWRLDF